MVLLLLLLLSLLGWLELDWRFDWKLIVTVVEEAGEVGKTWWQILRIFYIFIFFLGRRKKWDKEKERLEFQGRGGRVEGDGVGGG